MLKSQKGYTLIELLIAVAISAIIGTMLVVSLSQTMSVSWGGSKRMEAIKQVENAMYHINRDAQVASTISTDTTGYWLVINLADSTNISYRIINPGNGGPVFLQRSRGGSNALIAQYIDTGSGLTSCSYNSGLLDVQVTATLTGFRAASETRRMMVYPRLNQSN
jgi:prepilin-type N-terminal cleavage/methylation domain-containing protein